MTSLYEVGGKLRRTMGFALMVALLSLGAISGCGSSNNDSFDFADSGQPDGGLDVVDPDAGIYPNIQVIQPFLSGAIDPIKVQYWDQTYYWGPDSAGNDACFKGTVGILDSPNLAQETAPGPECPTPLGQVTPCNPAAAADTVASGAVQPAISGCEYDGAACTDILVPGITDEVTCESTVRQADPIAAGAAWFQNIDAPGTKGGTASHWWYGTRADKTFDAEDGYGGTQVDYISDATNINIAASGGGRGPTTRVNNIYLCSNKDVVNPAESPDVCTLSSLFGSCDKGDLKECKINNIGLVDGAYNVFIRSATPSEGFGGAGAANWPTDKIVSVAYFDATAAASAAMVRLSAFPKESYAVLITGFADENGNAINKADLSPLNNSALKLLSIGGASYHFTEKGLNVDAIATTVSGLGYDGVDLDIEAVDTGKYCGTCPPNTGPCPLVPPKTGTICGTMKSDAWIKQLNLQIEQLKEKVGIVTMAPGVILGGDYNKATLGQAQVIKRSDLPLDAIIQSGNVTAIIVQTYNGLDTERDPRIIQAVYKAAKAKYPGVHIVIGIPTNSGGTYKGVIGKTCWGCYQ
ncbi:MAG: hypothetical protein ACJ04P_06665, partial [Halioglobus sp.]